MQSFDAETPRRLILARGRFSFWAYGDAKAMRGGCVDVAPRGAPRPPTAQHQHLRDFRILCLCCLWSWCTRSSSPEIWWTASTSRLGAQEREETRIARADQIQELLYSSFFSFLCGPLAAHEVDAVARRDRRPTRSSSRRMSRRVVVLVESSCLPSKPASSELFAPGNTSSPGVFLVRPSRIRPLRSSTASGPHPAVGRSSRVRASTETLSESTSRR
jgi:hypothetical protein